MNKQPYNHEHDEVLDALKEELDQHVRVRTRGVKLNKDIDSLSASTALLFLTLFGYWVWHIVTSIIGNGESIWRNIFQGWLLFVGLASLGGLNAFIKAHREGKL